MILFSAATIVLYAQLSSASNVGTQGPPKPPPKPPPKQSLASSTSILSTSIELPLRNSVDSSSNDISVALYGKMAAIGDSASSSFTLQTLQDDSNTWKEVAFVNVSVLASNSSSSDTAISYSEVARAIDLSQDTILLSKVSSNWVFTADCPESDCLSSWYETECCSSLAWSDSPSLLAYSYDSNMNVVLDQEIDFALTQEGQSNAVTDILIDFTSSDSFYTSVSWVQKNLTSNIYSSHSQIYFASLSHNSDESNDAKWEIDYDFIHQHYAEDEYDSSSDSVDEISASVAVSDTRAVQGFHNYSGVAQSSGIVFCYARMADNQESTTEVSTDSTSESVWQQIQTLHPFSSEESDDELSLKGAFFGSSVAMKTDTLAIGAYGLGCAYIYTLNRTLWQSQGMLIPSYGMTTDLFGYSMQFLNTEQLVIGAPLSTDSSGLRSGSVFKFGFISDLDQWIELSKVEVVNASGGDCFGSSIEAVDDNLYLVGAFPNSVIRRAVDIFVDDDGAFSINNRIFSLNFTDCATTELCTDAYYNETSNATTPEICTSYSTCKKDSTVEAERGGEQSTQVLLIVLVIGAAILLVPAVTFVAVLLRRRRQQLERGEYLGDDSNDNRAAPVLRMTPLDTLEEGENGKSCSDPPGNIGESPVGRPPLASGQKKGRGTNSYTALNSQAHVEPASPASQQGISESEAASSSLSSVTTVGGLLSKLRSNLGGSNNESAKEEQSVNSLPEKDMSDINSPGGPPRPLLASSKVNKPNPFVMPAVVE